jgi:hypothetical protein
MGDLSWKLAGETKMGRRFFDPAQNGAWLRRSVEGRVDLDRGKKARIPREPLGGGQVARVKDFAPFLEAPSARADADFMLMIKIQNVRPDYFSEQNGFNLV